MDQEPIRITPQEKIIASQEWGELYDLLDAYIRSEIELNYDEDVFAKIASYIKKIADKYKGINELKKYLLLNRPHKGELENIQIALTTIKREHDSSTSGFTELYNLIGKENFEKFQRLVSSNE